MNFEKNDENCCLWSILASFHPCNNNGPNRVSKYKQYFNELKIDGFGFTIGLKCIGVQKKEKLNNLSTNIFELNFYKNQNKCRLKLVSIEVSKIESDRVTDLLIYKNHYAFIKKLNVFLGDHHKTFIRRRCLSSYTSENILMLHRPKCEKKVITTNRTSPESHLHWKKHFQKNPIYFRYYADFEADNAKDKPSVGKKTTNNYKQKPVLNGYLN